MIKKKELQEEVNRLKSKIAIVEMQLKEIFSKITK